MSFLDNSDWNIQDHFLEELTWADRNYFYDVILEEKTDSLIFFFSSLNRNFYQRKEAF